MKILVIAEHDNTHLNNSTLNTLTAAACLPDASIDILVAGYQCKTVAEKAVTAVDINQVLLADDKAYENHTAENLASLILSLQKESSTEREYDVIMAPSTTFGKNFLPRVAALLDVDQISDVCRIDINAANDSNNVHQICFLRPIYAGNALQTVISNDPVQVMTIRTSAFNAAAFGNRKAEIKEINITEITADLHLSTYLGLEAIVSKRPDLAQAKTIVSGGRGFQSAQKFKLIEALADKLNGAIGASRAAVDAGFAPNDCQVGQTGKIVAPNLYIALGISGAIQHLAGMKDSRVIVAINKDPEAPIFKIATYGLVGDLFEIIPQLLIELDKAA